MSPSKLDQTVTNVESAVRHADLTSEVVRELEALVRDFARTGATPVLAASVPDQATV